MPPTADTWQVHALRNARPYNGGGGWAAVAPGCPIGPHPHRWCKCKITDTAEQARAYIATQEVADAK